MTATFVRGRTGPLSVQWYVYPGGPPSNVTGVTITIASVLGVPVLGPTAVGVTNPATGVDVYAWAVDPAQAGGDYLVTWSGTDPEGDTVQTSEVVTVIAAGTDQTGPCEPWTPTFTCALPVGAPAVSGLAVAAATEVLYALSGRQFGLCTETLRPCRRDCYGSVWPYQDLAVYGATYPRPVLFAGDWYNLVCSACGTSCSCSVVSEALLPGPVHDVVQVKVDGVVLTPGTDYRLDSSRILVRLGAEWPLCNDLNRMDDQPGTWSVTFRSGLDVPPLGAAAVGILAVEFMKLFLCDATCTLPKPVQSLSRQGVNITFLDPNEVFANGRLGLYLPDLFIQTYNPDGHRQPPMVFDIDNPDRWRRLGV